MASSLNGTGVTFSDGSQLATAAPANSQIGGLIMAYYAVNAPTNSSPGSLTSNNFAAETSIAGSSLRYNILRNASGSQQATYNTPYATASGFAGLNMGQFVPISNGTITFPTSTITASTPSGTWRSISAFSNTGYVSSGCCSITTYQWGPALYTRTA